MLVFAQCLLDKGFVIQKHHIARQHRLMVGRFSLADTFDEEMQRSTRTARLCVADIEATRRSSPREIGKNLLQPLFDAALIHWHDRVFTITGFERVEGGGVERCSYRQSWLLRMPTAEEVADIDGGRVSGQLVPRAA